MAFRLHEALGTQNERYFVAATPPAHSLACLRIDDPVTAAAARLATGVGGLAPHRTGFAPAGRQTEFHDVIASSLPSDQPCLVAPCTNALEVRSPALLHESNVARNDLDPVWCNKAAEVGESAKQGRREWLLPQ